MRTGRHISANLYRRLEAIKKSLSLTAKACETKIQTAPHVISQHELESLIDATSALRQGRELTEREAAANQAYASALESQWRYRGLTVTRTPETPELIDCAATRQLSVEDLGVLSRAISTRIRGLELTAEQLRIWQHYDSIREAQYVRAGFSSEAEFESWYASGNTAPADRVGMRR